MPNTPPLPPEQPSPGSPHLPPQPGGPTMKRGLAIILQAVIVLIGIGVLALMLWEPHLEGRNARATTFEIYFKDPFLAYVYVGSIPFFLALYRAFGLFGHVRHHGAFSQVTVDALRAIKHCAMAITVFVAGAVAFILMFGDGEDRPAGVFMCLLVAFASSVIAIAAAMFARNLQNTLGIDAGQESDPRSRRWGLVMPLSFVAVGVAVGAAGIRVGDTDDAPGAALMGILLMLVTVTLGVRAAWRGRANNLRNQNP